MNKVLPFLLPILALAIDAAPSYANSTASPVRFVMDCGSDKLYMGQSARCHFIVRSTSEFLEVEVVKFPEFRGFWSDNLALRQGPISLFPLLEKGNEYSEGAPEELLPRISIPRGRFKPLRLPELRPTTERQGLVGTYLIQPMMGKRDSAIEPMKITVRSKGSENGFPESIANDPIYISEMPKIEIMTLPPVPTDLAHAPYSGAVGVFSLNPMESQIPFQPNEPVSFRITLQGQGNFSELNGIPVQLPKDAELLAKKSFTQGMGEYSSKTFEYSLILHQNQPVEQNLGSFIYFNPKQQQYLSLTLPTVNFNPMPPVEIRQQREPFVLPPPETEWSQSVPLWKNAYFLFSQVCLILFFGSTLFRRRLLQRNELREKLPAYQREKKRLSAIKEQRQGHSESFLKAAASLVIDILRDDVGDEAPKHFLTRPQLLRMARKKIPSARLEKAESLLQAHDALYSPERSIPVAPEVLVENLNTLAKKAGHS